MDARDMIQLINLLLALVSILPSSLILAKLIRVRRIIAVGDRRLNKALTIIFGGIVSLAVVNASVALLTVFDLGMIAHYFSPFGRFVTNVFFSISSWLIYFVNKEIEGN